jgi:hypothetical protein
MLIEEHNRRGVKAVYGKTATYVRGHIRFLNKEEEIYTPRGKDYSMTTSKIVAIIICSILILLLTLLFQAGIYGFLWWIFSTIGFTILMKYTNNY